ncbi:MAG: hypothetical protein WDO73_04340 [Ignavibacteriota bacterium]
MVSLFAENHHDFRQGKRCPLPQLIAAGEGDIPKRRLQAGNALAAVIWDPATC